MRHYIDIHRYAANVYNNGYRNIVNHFQTEYDNNNNNINIIYYFTNNI